jgi:hypothetical protein
MRRAVLAFFKLEPFEAWKVVESVDGGCCGPAQCSVNVEAPAVFELCRVLQKAQ